jgi:S-formylglutathione hydrolase FrmB
MNQIRAYRSWRKTYCREVQKVDDANGLCSVLELVAGMAAVPKTIGAVSDWREHDPLLTPEQVAKRLNTSLDWVWDHSSRKNRHLTRHTFRR